MNLNIKNTNFSLTPEIADYLEKKLMTLDKIVQFDRDNVFVHAELAKVSNHHKTGDVFKAEIRLQIGGRQIIAKSEKEDILAAIDDVKDELTREVKSSKDKRKSLIRRGGQKIKNILRFGREEI